MGGNCYSYVTVYNYNTKNLKYYNYLDLNFKKHSRKL